MDRGVLCALFVAKSLLPLPCALLFVTGCFLNPQGEDPGFEEGNAATANGTPVATGFFPTGPGDPGAAPIGDPGPSLGVDPVTGAPLTPDDSAGPGATPMPEPGAPGIVPPAGTATPQPTPTPTMSASPEPAGAGGASFGEPGASGAGGSEVEAGEQFDGGPFNYGSPDGDAGPGDGGLDAGDEFTESDP